MVSVYSHRYLPPAGGNLRHPVLSIYQTDVDACTAPTLVDFLTLVRPRRRAAEPRRPNPSTS